MFQFALQDEVDCELECNTLLPQTPSNGHLPVYQLSSRCGLDILFLSKNKNFKKQKKYILDHLNIITFCFVIF